VGVVGKMVRGKQGLDCRSKAPQPSEARPSGSYKTNLWAVAIDASHSECARSLCPQASPARSSTIPVAVGDVQVTDIG
jgi:hypothetical protein